MLDINQFKELTKHISDNDAVKILDASIGIDYRMATQAFLKDGFINWLDDDETTIHHITNIDEFFYWVIAPIKTETVTLTFRL